MKKLVLMGLALWTVLLGACQKSPDDANPNGADKGNNPPQKVIIALDWTPNTNHTGLYVAKDLGYFTEQGVDAQIVQPAEDSAAELVGYRRADLGVYFQPNLAKRLDKGVPLVAMAAILQENTAGIAVKGAPKSLHDMVGKRYSTWQDPIDDHMAKTVIGGDVIPIGGDVFDAAKGFMLDQFDGIMIYQGWDGIQLVRQNIPHRFFLLKSENSALDFYSPIIIAHKDNADSARIQSAMIAIKKGYEYAAKNPDKAADILLKYAPENDADFIHQSQKFISPLYLKDGKFGVIDKTRWDNYFNWLYEQKLLDNPLPKGAGIHHTVNDE